MNNIEIDINCNDVCEATEKNVENFYRFDC